MQRLNTSNFTKLITLRALPIWVKSLFYLLYAFLVLLLKTPGLFRQPRLWAEEGPLFYEHFQRGNYDIFTYAPQGHLVLLTNFSLYLASLFPIYYAPTATTFFSFSVLMLMFFLLIFFCHYINVAFFQIILLISSIIFIPSSLEVFLTSTNLQWLSCINITLILLILLHHTNISPIHFVGLFLVFAFGLTGAPSLTNLAAYVIAFLLYPRRNIFLYLLVLLICFFYQIFIISNNITSLSTRAFSLDIVFFGDALIVNMILSLFFSTFSIIYINSTIGLFYFLFYFRLVFISLFTIIFSRFLYQWSVIVYPKPSALLLLARSHFFNIILIVAIIFALIVNLAGMLPPRDQLYSGWAGGRYFFSSSVLLLLWLASLSRHPSKFARRVSTALLMTSTLSGFLAFSLADWPGIFTGPPWQSQSAGCERPKPCIIEIWPVGWYVVLSP